MPAYEFNLNVDPGGMPPVIHLAQYDTGRTYYANLKQGGEYYYLGLGATAKIKGRNARGVCWELDCTVNTSLTYQVQFTPEGAATDQFGIMPVQMELTAGDGVISTLLMVWDIQKAGYTSEEAARSPEFATAMEEAVDEGLTDLGVLLSENQSPKTPSMTTPIGVDSSGKLWVASGGGWSDGAKTALLNLLAKVAYIDTDGQDLYDALEAELYPPLELSYITADYEQDRAIYDYDSLDAIKAGDDLVVTAYYSDGSHETLGDNAYTLSGTLTAGTSTITVAYGGKTATIEVNVTDYLSTISFESNAWVRNGYSGHEEYVHEQNVAARARSATIIENHGYVFTIVDTTKYNIVVYNVTSDQLEYVQISRTEYGYCYPGVSNSKSWATSDSSISTYALVVLKKLDNTEFTAEELTNAYGTIFTATKS